MRPKAKREMKDLIPEAVEAANNQVLDQEIDEAISYTKTFLATLLARKCKNGSLLPEKPGWYFVETEEFSGCVQLMDYQVCIEDQPKELRLMANQNQTDFIESIQSILADYYDGGKLPKDLKFIPIEINEESPD